MEVLAMKQLKDFSANTEQYVSLDINNVRIEADVKAGKVILHIKNKFEMSDELNEKFQQFL
jgi:hypothetical protein